MVLCWWVSALGGAAGHERGIWGAGGALWVEAELGWELSTPLCAPQHVTVCDAQALGSPAQS